MNLVARISERHGSLAPNAPTAKILPFNVILEGDCVTEMARLRMIRSTSSPIRPTICSSVTTCSA